MDQFILSTLNKKKKQRTNNGIKFKETEFGDFVMCTCLSHGKAYIAQMVINCLHQLMEYPILPYFVDIQEKTGFILWKCLDTSVEAETQIECCCEKHFDVTIDQCVSLPNLWKDPSRWENFVQLWMKETQTEPLPLPTWNKLKMYASSPFKIPLQFTISPYLQSLLDKQPPVKVEAESIEPTPLPKKKRTLSKEPKQKKVNTPSKESKKKKVRKVDSLPSSQNSLVELQSSTNTKQFELSKLPSSKDEIDFGANIQSHGMFKVQSDQLMARTDLG